MFVDRIDQARSGRLVRFVMLRPKPKNAFGLGLYLDTQSPNDRAEKVVDVNRVAVTETEVPPASSTNILGIAAICSFQRAI